MSREKDALNAEICQQVLSAHTDLHQILSFDFLHPHSTSLPPPDTFLSVIWKWYHLYLKKAQISCVILFYPHLFQLKFVKTDPRSSVSKLKCHHEVFPSTSWNDQNDPESNMAAQKCGGFFPPEILSPYLEAQNPTGANSIIIKCFKNIPVSVMQ